MKNIEKYNVEIIDIHESTQINGGKYWNPFWLALYVLEEVYEGATRECTSSCEH